MLIVFSGGELFDLSLRIFVIMSKAVEDMFGINISNIFQPQDQLLQWAASALLCLLRVCTLSIVHGRM